MPSTEWVEQIQSVEQFQDAKELLEPDHITAVFMWSSPLVGKGRQTQTPKCMECVCGQVQRGKIVSSKGAEVVDENGGCFRKGGQGRCLWEGDTWADPWGIWGIFGGRAVQTGEIASAKALRGSVPFTQMGKDLWEVDDFYFRHAALRCLQDIQRQCPGNRRDLSKDRD